MEKEYFTLKEILEMGPAILDTSALIGTLNGKEEQTSQIGLKIEAPKVFLPHIGHGGVYIRPGVQYEYMQRYCPSDPMFVIRFNVLATIFGSRGILKFTGRDAEDYRAKYQRMRELAKKWNISEVDYDGIVCASVLNRNNGGASFICEDFPLVKTWADLCNLGFFSPEQVRVFTRESLDDFKMKRPLKRNYL